ncbi:MAG TPA: flagellar basal body rod protein FlgB [Campylobacterales bacterium]|nr:flagellar basal body rod protein FlgB [Campylobacterales bacterium]
MVETTKSSAIVEKALDYRSLRQKLISGNLANVDTPFYRARDISFENVLAKEADKLADIKKQPAFAKTHHMHMDPVTSNGSNQAEVFFRGTHTTRNDGNNVDLDIESTEMSKNSMMYNALISAKKKSTMIFKSVIDASSKVQ